MSAAAAFLLLFPLLAGCTSPATQQKEGDLLPQPVLLPLPVEGTFSHDEDAEGNGIVSAVMNGKPGQWVMLRVNFTQEGAANVTVSMTAEGPCCSIWMTDVAAPDEIPERKPKFGAPERRAWQLLDYPRIYEVEAGESVRVLLGSTQAWQAKVNVSGQVTSADAAGGEDLQVIDTDWLPGNNCSCLVGEARIQRDTPSLLLATWYEDLALRSEAYEINATFPDASQRTAMGVLAFLTGQSFTGSGWGQVAPPGEMVLSTKLLTTSPTSFHPVIISIDWPEPWWSPTKPKPLSFFDAGRSPEQGP